MSTMWERLSRMMPGKEEQQLEIFQAIRKSRSRKYMAGSAIAEPQEVFEVLNLAADQRGQCQMDLVREGKKYSFSCDYMVVSKHSMALIYTNDSKRIPLEPGAEVIVYFQIRKMGKYQFYAFNAPIVATAKESQHSWVLQFAIPECLECRQRRAAIRVSPDKKLFRRVMIWSMPSLRVGLKSDPVKDWGKPFVIFVTGKTEQNFVKDISASGIRLQLPYRQYADKLQSLSTGAHFAMLLSLESVNGAPSETFLMIMRVRNQRTSDDSRFIEAGFQFAALSSPPKNIDDEVVWRDIRSKEGMIERLARWITAWSLEDLRKSNRFM